MHRTIEPAILYFGTPVALISTLNEDGSANLAPMSSAWWLGWTCMLGLGQMGQTSENLIRTGECVINLPSHEQVSHVDRLALTTGRDPVPDKKREWGYRYEAEKFQTAGLTPVLSVAVAPPRALECPVQLEGVVHHYRPFGKNVSANVFEVHIVKVHAHPDVLDEKSRIDPHKWRPLIMSFCRFFVDGRGAPLAPRGVELHQVGGRNAAQMTDDRNAQSLHRIRSLCEYIEQHAHEPLTLAALSRRAGLSPFHLQRCFKTVTGVTPKQYHDNCRMKGFKSILRRPASSDVTGAIFEAGYSSISRLYEKADTRLGMTPMEYRAGGRGVTITYATTHTPLGLLMIGATDRGICFLQFGESTDSLIHSFEREYPNAVCNALQDPPPADFRVWIDALNRHLDGSEPDIRLPLHVRSTAFQLKVWTYLQTIPYGSVQRYKEVACGIGEPLATRAVARACASNHTALLIPCHRVIRGTGALGGYRWGLDRKRVLLDSERRHRPDR